MAPPKGTPLAANQREPSGGRMGQFTEIVAFESNGPIECMELQVTKRVGFNRFARIGSRGQFDEDAIDALHAVRVNGLFWAGTHVRRT